MKKKTSSDQLVTVEVLRDVLDKAFDRQDKKLSNALDKQDKKLSNALDKQDKKLSNALDKQDKKLSLTLDKRDNKLFAFTRAEIKGTIYESEQRISDTLVHWRDDFYTKVDPLLKEIEDARIDRILTTEKLEEHGKRLAELEKN